MTENATRLAGELWKAIREGDLQRCRALVLAGADLAATSKDGWTALHVAATVEHPAITRLLLESGAPVGAGLKDGGWTPLHVAVARDHVETMKALLDGGADVNATASADFTPLHVAAWYNRLGAATSVLMQHGADPDAKTEKGRTAAELARHKDHPGVEVQIMALDAAVRSGWIESKAQGGGGG
ncbi:MAG: ankyrin repeat domain-containing protein [Alphaproteobacteria bacterium]|nr:ankyrin repeat domain-containing protein [Alphaproteobacteria bacterium]